MMKKIPIRAVLFAFVALALIGCSNIFIDKPQNKEASPQDIPEGFGTVQVSLTQGAARTIMPEPVLDELYLQYWFTKDGGSSIEKTPTKTTSTGGEFTLEPGSYTLEVKAYVDSIHTRLAAQSAAAAAFTIIDGTAAGSVNVTLYPITATGTGSLDFSLQYPAGVTVETFTLTLIAGEEAPIDLKPAGASSGSGPITFSGTKTAISAGYYLLQVTLKNSSRVSSGRTEVVHIYQNMVSEADYVFTADDFRAYLVTNTNDSGPGSLRQALVDAPSGQTIRVALEPGSVIELDYYALQITSSVTIEGNGVTLGQGLWNSSVINYDNVLVRIDSEFAVVKISGVHFKNRSYDGHAIRNAGTLTLESCIFSKEWGMLYFIDQNGIAINSTNTLTIQGCTFYNSMGHSKGVAGYLSPGYSKGGAVYFNAPNKTLTLKGNLFYGTTAPLYPVVCVDSGMTSASYNVVDVGFGTGDTQCGWDAGNGNRLATALPISPKTFRLYGDGAKNVITTLPAGYPAQDFYGNPISNGAAAGAVQESTAGDGYYLEWLANDSRLGTAEVSPKPDEDGLVSGPFIITTSSDPEYTFSYCLVNGVQKEIIPTSLSEHTWIQMVFAILVTDVTDGPDSTTTPGTLRYALDYFNTYLNILVGVVDFSGVSAGTTIELRAPLQVNEDLTIKGNGVTLTRASSWTSPGSLLTTYSGRITISGVHFKDGRADTGGAIRNLQNLTLENCTFSGNQSTTGYGLGGAIYSGNGSSGTLTIRDCAFDENIAANSGGAIYNQGTLTLENCTFNDNESTAENGAGGAIYNSNALSIRGCAFDGNVAANGGGAIFNTGSLLLESCVLSDNESTTGTQAYGGAVLSTNALTIQGCTFYENTAISGGAVMVISDGSGKTMTLTLTGNLFYGNTATSTYPVVRVGSSTDFNASYNVVDKPFGTGGSYCGWAAGSIGDTTFTDLSISGAPFVDTTDFVPVSALRTPGVLPSSAPPGFPTTDFNGDTRTFPGAPGAVK
jgi:predicted outer membrane repeat protein